MGVPNGVHHLAIATADLKSQLEFFTEAVGAELVGLYWMHGVKDTAHAFLRLSDESMIALVYGPEIKAVQPSIGVSHAGFTAGAVAPGAVQHIALNVPTHEDLLAMRDRLRSHGYWVLGPIDHGMCRSIYLTGPEGMQLEFASSAGLAVRADEWIDAEVAAACGIDADALERYRRPSAFVSQGGAVAQPSPDLRPGFVFPEEMRELGEAMLRMSDEEIAAVLDHPTTPAQDRAAMQQMAMAV
ncbi:MAG TPA: VOC family protein [Candidatus Limnocylindrales bacterium]|nr:VOC family protein [Candidatus Limnocylindrales bacterium]